MRYILMHKEQAVLEMELDEVSGAILSIPRIISPQHIPIGVKLDKTQVDRATLHHWWISRSIPASRSGIRMVLEQLGVAAPQFLLTKCYGLSLSDQYWVCPKGRDLCWRNINFFQNPFSEDMGNLLFGELDSTNAVDLMSPDNTSDGCLKKRWKILNNERCLIKGGSAPFYQEPINEFFASSLMDRLKITHVPYQLIWKKNLPYSICPDFITSETELISAHHICQVTEQAQDCSKYQHFIKCCEILGIPNVKDAIEQMLTVDFLIANEDRHMNNFGAIRNADTLEWIGMAPIFDCGTSMWYNHLFRWGGPEADVACKPFSDMHSQQIKLVKHWDWLNLKELKGSERLLEKILDSAPQYIDDLRKQTLCEAFASRIYALLKIIKNVS